MLKPVTTRTLSLVFLLPLLLIAAALAAAACGGSDGDRDGGSTAFDITLNDEPGETSLVSFFTPKELTVTAGREVTFNLSNEGTVPHNMRIAGPDGEYNTGDDVVVDPEVLNVGDTAVLKWTAPSETGTIVFRCDFHLNTGTITVE